MNKIKLASIWLDGCSGCHMSFLDMDERLLELAEYIEYVSGPYCDVKFEDYPNDVDVCLIEGSVSNEEDLHKICVIRNNTKTLISLGDCAVTGNVSAMRNIFGPKECLAHAYIECASLNQHIPNIEIPKLLDKVKAVHEVVDVDIFIPGCPPPADAIYHILKDVIEGKSPDPAKYTRFGR